MNGIIVIDKPQGMTSHDVVSFLRRKTGVKRIGFSGTLDPMATGVLPLFIGRATRVIEYASKPGDAEAKLYRCKMKLGIETDTLDIWGTQVGRQDTGKLPPVSEVTAVLKGFEGPGRQKPPMYSAVKVRGRKLYEYARKGASVDEELIREREIYIKHINVNETESESDEISFDVLCSKGVYIRTLCADAGRLLGCGAAMSGLKRLKSDGFSIDSAVSYEELNDGEMPPLLPMDTPLGWISRVDIDGQAAESFAFGREIAVPYNECTGIVRVYNGEIFVGIGKITDGNKVKPEKVLSIS